jgi:hypothetical protein
MYLTAVDRLQPHLIITKAADRRWPQLIVTERS